MVIRNSLVRNAGVADHGHCQRRLQDSSDIFTEKSENLSKIYPKLPSTIFLATPPLLAFVHEAWRQQTDE